LLKVKMVIIMVNWFAMKTIVARIYHTQLTKARDIVKLFVANGLVYEKLRLNARYFSI